MAEKGRYCISVEIDVIAGGNRNMKSPSYFLRTSYLSEHVRCCMSVKVVICILVQASAWFCTECMYKKAASWRAFRMMIDAGGGSALVLSALMMEQDIFSFLSLWFHCICLSCEHDVEDEIVLFTSRDLAHGLCQLRENVRIWQHGKASKRPVTFVGVQKIVHGVAAMP